MKAKAKEYAKLANAAITAAAQMWLKEMSIQEKEEVRLAKKAKIQQTKSANSDTRKNEKEKNRKMAQIRKNREKREGMLQKGSEKGLSAIQTLFKKKRCDKHKVVIVKARRKPTPNMEAIADFMRK